MRLSDLAPGLPGTPVTGITADSRAVRPGMIFAALRGAKADGRAFIADAVARGAVAVLADDAEAPVPVIRDADPRRRLALLAAVLAGRQPETIVAVTGTAGKTSVAEFTRQVFAAAGHPAVSIGTLGIRGAAAVYGGLTTPDPVVLHERLAALAAAGVTHAAMEASSHGLDQRRLDGVRLAAAAFTNIGRDHLDYHVTPEAYLAAKLRLFEVLAADVPAVVDPDAPGGAAVLAVARHPFTVGRRGERLRLVAAERTATGARLALAGTARHDVELPLVGDFQVANALVAAGLAIAAGVDETTAVAALGGLVGAPGRLERVATRNGAPIFVDYAHKPDALTAALSALRPAVAGRLVCVVGAGGDRDPGKRPLMGRAAAAIADVVVVTDDNPRSEDPAAIRRAVLEGAPGAIEIGDRAAAIRAAIDMLETGDALVVAGKGHEEGQIVGDRVIPFSDRTAILEALR
jgi:UDP-N-acetylmuramoyl-L-alanyl-D-glutamate--2,6-diaminopimelate ligase